MSDRPRTLVRLSEAADELSVPRATARSWASEPNRRLWPEAADVDGVLLYDLADVRALAESTQRRRRRKKTSAQ